MLILASPITVYLLNDSTGCFLAICLNYRFIGQRTTRSIAVGLWASLCMAPRVMGPVVASESRCDLGLLSTLNSCLGICLGSTETCMPIGRPGLKI